MSDKKEVQHEIGDRAVWSLSSCKTGFGILQLRDGLTTTYWQFALRIYSDFKQDESYTPSLISIRIGSNFHDLKEIEKLELEEPSGWIDVPFTAATGRPVRTFVIQVAVIANHQAGRDTHLRQVQVFSPAR